MEGQEKDRLGRAELQRPLREWQNQAQVAAPRPLLPEETHGLSREMGGGILGRENTYVRPTPTPDSPRSSSCPGGPVRCDGRPAAHRPRSERDCARGCAPGWRRSGLRMCRLQISRLSGAGSARGRNRGFQRFPEAFRGFQRPPSVVSRGAWLQQPGGALGNFLGAECPGLNVRPSSCEVLEATHNPWLTAPALHLQIQQVQKENLLPREKKIKDTCYIQLENCWIPGLCQERPVLLGNREEPADSVWARAFLRIIQQMRKQGNVKRQHLQANLALELVIERTCPPIDPELDPGRSEAPPSLPCLWNICSIHHAHKGSCSKDTTFRD
ncbi:uncharacterized protein [Vicugna pacos]|uniref:Uncharacterized protein n=1 Tax=Vicugna pacos TaxID=30538 RepID=A0ABM5E9Z2_VICPA